MSKLSIKLVIENKEYILEENKEYIFEFKPGYEIGNLNNPFSKVRMMNIAFEGDSGETYFYIFQEESNEDYLICNDELLSITNI